MRNLPEQVFTPRAARVNREMYVAREWLEQALETALNRNTHIVIHGESGCGKSWLYKKLFEDLGVHYVTANLANASRLGSITKELENIVDRTERRRPIGHSETKAAELGAIAKGKLEHRRDYSIGAKEPFEATLEMLSENARGKKSVLVFDNLESAYSESLLKELADLIILCDDERYAAYAVQIAIVGVPKGLRGYFYRTPNLSAVGNRLYEVPEVSRLGLSQCNSLIKNGFGLLGIPLKDPNEVSKHIAFVTDRIPQRVHEYCLELALASRLNNGQVDSSILNLADRKWLRQSLYEVYSIVEDNMNLRGSAGRRNQAMYALSRIAEDEFKSAEVERVMRSEFKRSTFGVKLNMSKALNQLACSKNPLIRRTPKGDAYEFLDPRFRMAIRVILKKSDGENIDRTPLDRVQ